MKRFDVDVEFRKSGVKTITVKAENGTDAVHKATSLAVDMPQSEWPVLIDEISTLFVEESTGDMVRIGTLQRGLDPLPVFMMTDQPATCPQCGARTNFEAMTLPSGVKAEAHVCLDCKFEFVVEEIF